MLDLGIPVVVKNTDAEASPPSLEFSTLLCDSEQIHRPSIKYTCLLLW